MTDLLQVPDWPMLDDDLMSNFDYEVDQGVARQLRDGEVMAKYAGWNFNADCWFADGLFHAAVYRYHALAATMSAATPEELMTLVSDEFGWD